MRARGMRRRLREIMPRLRCLARHRHMWKVSRYLPVWTQWQCKICGCRWTYWRE